MRTASLMKLSASGSRGLDAVDATRWNNPPSNWRSWGVIDISRQADRPARIWARPAPIQGRNGVKFRQSFERRDRSTGFDAKAFGEEQAAMLEAAIVDAMSDAERQMPLARNVRLGERLRRFEQSLERDELILVAMDEQNRRRRAA